MAEDVVKQCKNGILVPAAATSTFHAILYLIALFYCFLGIAIIADIFMTSIERITSTTKKVRKQKDSQIMLKEDGQVNKTNSDDNYEYVKVWNPTVANLTLMALGSSAPEILLSLIEIAGNNFHSGDLGPGTIVGSAAFNIFVISAICIVSIQSPNSKRIESFSVFCVTTAFAVFAYLWLLIILMWISPNIVEVWEAALTLVFFFALVFIAYAVDVELWKKKRKAEQSHVIQIKVDQLDGTERTGEEAEDEIIPSIHRVKEMSREISREYPSLSEDEQAKLLAYRLNKNQRHDRLYYRIRAIRQFTSSWKEAELERDVTNFLKDTNANIADGRVKPRIEFSARSYGVHPSDKHVKLMVVRRGPATYPITLAYSTVDGVAKKQLHYLHKKEVLRLEEGERYKTISVQLVDGADWKPATVFYVHLKILDQEDEDRTKLGEINMAHIRMYHAPESFTGQNTVEFVKSNYITSENAGWVRVFAVFHGRPSDVSTVVYYETSDISAQENLDYVPVKNGKLEFTGNEIEKYFDVELIDDKKDEKDETFLIELVKTSSRDVSINGRKRTIVTIVSDDNVLRNVVNLRKHMKKHLKSLELETATWKEQIKNAVSVNAGDIDNATVTDALLHALAMPWKLLFAFVPPPGILGGWACFFVALAAIGVLTAVVGDVASLFGCMIGLKDAITAVTIVALGTSLPDTFASRIAAQNDPTADNAIGNVTGSNSVNVFLGLGLPWLVASIYWAIKGESFVVEAGDLGFSVLVYTVLSLFCIAILLMRRFLPWFGKGELGGPLAFKLLHAAFFVLLWVIYIVCSIVKIQSADTEIAN